MNLESSFRVAAVALCIWYVRTRKNLTAVLVAALACSFPKRVAKQSMPLTCKKSEDSTKKWEEPAGRELLPHHVCNGALSSQDPDPTVKTSQCVKLDSHFRFMPGA